ncbi:MAG: PD40 domain-containing protein [Candidatus Latescibacteria bacterium]|nr:PD40 domain-containing protein [Candidatus Latescibacterota bacterium]
MTPHGRRDPGSSGTAAIGFRATALLVMLAALAGCEHRAGVVGVTGVVWDRVTPSPIVSADSPDWHGDSIAFQVVETGLDRIAVADEDGSGIQVQPETGGAGSRNPRWVADGLLVHSSNLSGSEDLWYRDVASGGARRLTSLAGNEWSPVPRPGRPGLVYVEGSDPSSGRLVLIPDTAAAPLGRIYLTPGTLAASEPDWDPAGERLCFTVRNPDGSSQIWSLSMRDTLPIQLTVGVSPQPLTGPQIDRNPRFSPDGTSILIASNRGNRWGVWTLSPLGEARGLTLIAQDLPNAEIRHPAWSPDGTRILLSSDRSGGRALWRLSNLGI